LRWRCWLVPAVSFEGPNDHQYQQNQQKIFHPTRPIKTSKTKREPA
jgi:hypothetical protein